jgi:hypothetical protein
MLGGNEACPRDDAAGSLVQKADVQGKAGCVALITGKRRTSLKGKSTYGFGKNTRSAAVALPGYVRALDKGHYSRKAQGDLDGITIHGKYDLLIFPGVGSQQLGPSKDKLLGFSHNNILEP